MDIERLTTARWELLRGGEVSEVTRELIIELLSDRLGFAPPGLSDAETRPVGPLPAADCPSLIALCLGHARSGDQGAVSVGGVSEEMWHRRVGMLTQVQTRLAGYGIRSIVVEQYEGNSYVEAMTWLARHLRSRGATAAVEFHFNSGPASAWGHETLYHEFSRYGVRLAEMVEARWGRDLPGPRRGVQPRSTGQRGALFLSRTHCPAAILEPFFGSNRQDWEYFSGAPERLADSTAAGIADFAKFYREAKV